VDGLRGLGPAGAAWFGGHLLALPTQSALLLLPASGSCLDLAASGATAFRLCPWQIHPVSPLAGAILFTGPLPLSPAFWILSMIAPAAAFLGGRRAGAGRGPGPGVACGAVAGGVFAALGVLGAAFAAPRILAPSVVGWLRLTIETWSLGAAGLLCLWGVVGGAAGGWLAGRRYAEPELPRPTSA
jgi:hypothetical protein